MMHPTVDIKTFFKPGTRVHLAGIGGVSMCPLAEVLAGMGLQVQGSDMSESERVTERRELAEMERDVARRSREARDEFNQRRNEEVLLLQGRAGRIIQQIAESEKFDLVLYEFFYASPKVDITDRVMKALDADVKPAKKKK